MTKYREILRLTALGLSQRSIIRSINVSQKTIVKVQRRAQELKLSWPLDDSLTDDALDKLMFPKANGSSRTKRMPDYDYIQKELLRNGVNKKLLWTEYLEECRLSGEEPLMYSQFCYYIQQDEKKHQDGGKNCQHCHWRFSSSRIDAIIIWSEITISIPMMIRPLTARIGVRIKESRA